MIIFFDLGIKGGYSIFEKNKLIYKNKFNLGKEAKKSNKNKIFLFKSFLEKTFPKTNKFKKIGTFEPFGKNAKTIMSLSFMISTLIFHFSKSSFFLLNEWSVWRDATNNSKIPKRKIKKNITIKWVEKKFKIKNLNDDEADAIIGGYYLFKYLK